MVAQCVFAQQFADHKIEINRLIEAYSKSVIEKDSTAFYSLFTDGTVTWCAALKNGSQAREAEKKGEKRSNYFSGSYKGFFKGLYKYEATEDKFDNVWIAEDGTVASVMMDYSFHANKKMTNWGNKYLTLIKRDGKWKIVSVIYSLELAEYFPQPPLEERKKLRRMDRE
jgi:ketosteroid isomerase-like protein